MKKIAFLATVLLSAATIFAQEREEPGRRTPRPEGNRNQVKSFTPNAGSWVTGMFSRPEVIEKIGVTDDALKAKIAEELRKLHTRGVEIERTIRELSIKQAELFKAVLSDKDADTAPLFAKIDEIATLRTLQGKLSVEALVFLRDNLTPEQIAKAIELVENFGKERGKMRGQMPYPEKRELNRPEKRNQEKPGEGKVRRPRPFDEDRPARAGKDKGEKRRFQKDKGGKRPFQIDGNDEDGRPDEGSEFGSELDIKEE